LGGSNFSQTPVILNPTKTAFILAPYSTAVLFGFCQLLGINQIGLNSKNIYFLLITKNPKLGWASEVVLQSQFCSSAPFLGWSVYFTEEGGARSLLLPGSTDGCGYILSVASSNSLMQI